MAIVRFKAASSRRDAKTLFCGYSALVAGVLEDAAERTGGL